VGAGIEEATTTSKHSCSVFDSEWSPLINEVPFMAVESALNPYSFRKRIHDWIRSDLINAIKGILWFILGTLIF
jgi:hypothetical protein